jgi:hypothetical protein
MREMSITSKKNTVRKGPRRKQGDKPMSESKYIGLDEKMADAERMLRSLKNPELLRK